ncbi:hypothetical protein MMC32_001147 [Xylographa parallela]|nr:hypothetical protein [Xylographa parallela]
MPTTRAAVKRKLMPEQALDSSSQETVPVLKKRKKIAPKKPREPSKKATGKKSAAPPNKVRFADTKTPEDSKSIAQPTVPPARPVPKRPLTNSKSEPRTTSGKVRGRPPTAITQLHRPRTPTSLPSLGAALKQSWQANLPAGGHSSPHKWNSKTHYRDRHVFSDGTFAEDAQPRTPLPSEPPRPPSPAFRPVARPKSNFAAYEALFGGQGPSGLKGTRAPAAATKQRNDLLPPDLDAKLRASLGLADLALSRTRDGVTPRGRRRLRDGLRGPATGLGGVVARGDTVAVGVSDCPADEPNPFTAPRSELLRAARVAAERRKRGLPTRDRTGPNRGGNPRGSVPRHRGRADVSSGDAENPLVGVFTDAEMQVAKRQAAEANATEKEVQEQQFACVAGPTTPRWKRAPQPSSYATPWSGAQNGQAQEDMQQRLFAASPVRGGGEESEADMDARERRQAGRLTEAEAQTRDEELEAIRWEQLAQRRRRKAMARAARERRVRLARKRRKRESGEGRRVEGRRRPPLEGLYARDDGGVGGRWRGSVSPDLSSSWRGGGLEGGGGGGLWGWGGWG